MGNRSGPYSSGSDALGENPADKKVIDFEQAEVAPLPPHRDLRSLFPQRGMILSSRVWLFFTDHPTSLKGPTRE